MAYSYFDGNKPDIAGTRQTGIDGTRNNLLAVRDMIVSTGTVTGFNYTNDYATSGGTEDQPNRIYFTRGARTVRVDFTWGTSGGAAGAVVKMAFYVSVDSRATWDAMIDGSGNYVMNLTYSASGNCVSTSWGSVP